MTYKPFSVAQINDYIKNLMENDALLAELRIEGEISNFKHHSSGHMYFTLKDSAAALNTVMFASHTHTLKFVPKNGMQVVVDGYISVYKKTGQYQLYAQFMQTVGGGALEAAFKKLQESLAAAGLFDPARKKALPPFADSVALVTSPTGAALQDMLKVIRARNKSVKILLAPCLVQGEAAAPDIAAAIRRANRTEADIIIVARGGGSAEDLWAFNEEEVARAIAASAIPVISAIGHETDFTIADLAADVRAPTPSAAAAMAVPDLSLVILRKQELQKRAETVLRRRLTASRAELEELTGLLHLAIESKLAAARKNLAQKHALVEKLSPYALWKRGFSAVIREDGSPLKAAAQVSTGARLDIFLQDGRVVTEVLETELL